MNITFDAILATHALSQPHAAAIMSPNCPDLSYAQLHAHIGRVGQQLTAWGLGQHDRVVLVLPNGPEAAVAFLCVAAHMTCAPLNPDYSAPEYDFYLSDLRANALIVLTGSQSPVIAVATAQRIPILWLTPHPSVGAGAFDLATTWRVNTRRGNAPIVALADVASLDTVALLLHTSGTTARPKLVPLTHANLSASANNIKLSLALSADDRGLNVMPLFHIHGLMAGVLAPLMAGGSVVCTAKFNAEPALACLAQFHPTWYSAVPTMHQAIVAVAKANGAQTLSHTLRFIRSSSSALPAHVLLQLETMFKVPVIEAYGMTEAAHQMASTLLPNLFANPLPRKIGSVGRATGVEIAILDAAGQQLAALAVGEIAIRGNNVMSGYVDNPTANAAAFCGEWFRTGDQGYFDEDGYLFINGRLKEIINRGGEKISPREVDDVLLAHPAVVQAVTFALPHPTLGETVAAAVKLHSAAHVTEAALQQFVALSLATFKVPARVVFVDEIPKGATGKIQRIGLADKLKRELANSQVRVGDVAPLNAVETGVAAIWQAVLGLEAIGIHDYFLDLGGDSLRATQIIARVLRQFRVAIPPQLLLTTASVATMAATIVQYQTQLVDASMLEMLLNDLEN